MKELDEKIESYMGRKKMPRSLLLRESSESVPLKI